MTHFRASQCAGPVFWMNWDKIPIANAISGRDMTAGHKTLPTASAYGCHGLCSVTFFPKNNQRTAPTESPMMATSPLFSATITTGHPHRTYIGAPLEYSLHSATTRTTCILIIVITNQHHVLSTTAQPQPHHAPHMFHPEYESPCYMFILLSYALHDNSLYVYVLLQYKYSSLLYVFR